MATIVNAVLFVLFKLTKFNSNIKQGSVGLYVITSFVQYVHWINFELVPLYSKQDVSRVRIVCSF